MANKIYVGDTGTEFIVDTGTDVSSATKLALKVLKPEGVSAEWVGSSYQTTKIKYTTVADDLNVAGEYAIQAYVEMPAWTGRGETVVIRVHAPFK